MTNEFCGIKIKVMKKVLIAALILSGSLCSCKEQSKEQETSKNSNTEITMNAKELSNKEKAIALIESLETGATEPIAYINPEKYIQHNLAVADGLDGFGAVMANAPDGGFKAKVIRAFEDGDYVVLHNAYDFLVQRLGLMSLGSKMDLS